MADLMDSLVQLENVTKKYDSLRAGGSPAVANISMTVAAGEAVAIMGPSGSGKSTLLNLIAGLDRPTSGTVRVGGERIGLLSETSAARFRRRRVGMIFQFFNLLDDMTVIDNVLLPAQLAGQPKAEARARADELLTKLRIGQYEDTYPARLSGGERQRVAIARALANRPPLLLLADEPTGALDTANGEEIGELLLDLNSSLRFTAPWLARYAQPNELSRLPATGGWQARILLAAARPGYARLESRAFGASPARHETRPIAHSAHHDLVASTCRPPACSGEEEIR
jgi:putative ABC transport system ATP-binding protein